MNVEDLKIQIKSKKQIQEKRHKEDLINNRFGFAFYDKGTIDSLEWMLELLK